MRVTATNSKLAGRRLRAAGLAVAAFLGPCTPVLASSNRALLIGISQYADPDPDMRDLAYADEDVKAFGSILKGFAGYGDGQVELLLNADATKERISAALLGAVKASRAEPLDRFILMFAGHGLPAEIKSGKTNSFLAPHDAVLKQFFKEGAGELVANETFINKAWLLSQLAAINARDVIIILDSCYSGAKDFGELYAKNLGFKVDLRGAGGLQSGVVILRKGPEEPVFERRIAFLASSRENQPSAEYQELRHGAFSHALFEHLGSVMRAGDPAERREVTIGGAYTAIAGLFNRVRVKGRPLSLVHQPVLVPIPGYDEVKDMPFVELRGGSAALLGAKLPPDVSAPGSPSEGLRELRETTSRAAQPPTGPTGELRFDTGGELCEVAVDGLATGRLSNETFTLSEGKHLVSLYLPGTNFNRTLVVDIRAGKRRREKVALQGLLKVESRPAEPGHEAPRLEVYLDGRSVGRTPVTLDDIVAGTHHLRIKVGATTRERKIEIRPDSPLLMRYKIVLKGGPGKRESLGSEDVPF